MTALAKRRSQGVAVTNPDLKSLPLTLVGPCSATLKISPRPAFCVDKKVIAFQTSPPPNLTASTTRSANEYILYQLVPFNIPADHRHINKLKCNLLSSDQTGKTTQLLCRVMSNNKHLLSQATEFEYDLLCNKC